MDSIALKEQAMNTAESGICMVVDPKPDSLRKTIRIWKKMVPGAECHGFLSGEEARSFFLSHPVDLVFWKYHSVLSADWNWRRR